MSYFQPFSISRNNPEADDSSTVFDADTVTPDEIPSTSLLAMPPLPALATTAAATDYHHQQQNNNESIFSTSIQEESPANTISELLRRINARHPPAEPSTTTAAATATATVCDANTVMPGQQESPATATRSEEIEISTNESSSSSSKKRSSTNSSSHLLRKKTRKSSRLKRQQPQDQSCVDKSDSKVEDENELEDYEPGEAVINQSSSSSSQISTKRQRQNELKWKSKFQELRAHKQLHGHTNVSTQDEDNKQLGIWISTQRTEYKKFKANKKAYITKERIQTLEKIGFEWVSPKNESKWNERFNELKAYKEKYDHTNVPQKSKDNKKLANWVKIQRREYKNFQENKKSQMTNERIQTLESIGFEWVSPNKGGVTKDESAWNKRFNELKDYKEKYGHTDVTRYSKDTKQLGTWVNNQRKEYKKFHENKKSQMTNERIQTLESIGFQWECRPARPPRS